MSPTRILVTGGTGFLGRALCRALLAAHPHASVLPVGHEDADLRAAAAADALFGEVQPDLCYHLAATIGGIGANMRRPADFIRDNLLMGVHVLDAAVQSGVRKVVTVGTVCMYPCVGPLPFREYNLWYGYPEATNAPYGIAKRALLTLAQAYRQQHGLRTVMAIPTNLYGPGDNFDPTTSHVIPALIRRMLEATASGMPSVTVWGTGSATREFLYVEDAAEALVQMGIRYDAAEPINLGSGGEVGMADLARTIQRMIGYPGELCWDPSRPDGQPRRQVDSTLAKVHLGWQASTPMDEGLRRTIAYARETLGLGVQEAARC